jgi:hypothetical protein
LALLLVTQRASLDGRRVRRLGTSNHPIDAADQCDTGSQISSERVPCFAVQYSTSPQKRSKEGGRALSVEAPLGMSMEMLTFDTNLGGYRTDITEQQIRGAPAFSRDQTSTNVEAFA